MDLPVENECTRSPSGIELDSNQDLYAHQSSSLQPSMCYPLTRHLLRENITYSQAKEREVNILPSSGTIHNGMSSLNMYANAAALLRC